MSENNSPLGKGGFHHIALKASDFDKTMIFYTEVLGFKKTISWGEGDNRAIMLDTGNGNLIEIFAGGTAGEKPEGSILHLAFRTDNCDQNIEQVRAFGAEITREPVDVDIPSEPVTRVRIAFCKGPDGEVLEFFQYR